MLACNIRSELIKHVFAFDGDIDIFNPRDVMWAIATRTQWCRDVITFPQAKMLILDPSIEPDRVSDIGGIDCTKPWGEPYEERVGIDQQVLERLKLENFISPEALALSTCPKCHHDFDAKDHLEKKFSGVTASDKWY
jgi:3-polyprenyl-4-hydroxybenzoate decarboxylase